MSAKFIAQIEIVEPACRGRARRRRRPARGSSASAAARRRPASRTPAPGSPASPARRSAPTCSIASRFASLKSDHIAEAPVRLTPTPGTAAAASSALRSVGGVDHLVRVPRPRRPGSRPCGRRREIDRPGAAARPADGGIGPRGALRPGHRLRGTRARSPEVRRVHDDQQRVAAPRRRSCVDLLARRDRLRAVRLPAGAGERVSTRGAKTPRPTAITPRRRRPVRGASPPGGPSGRSDRGRSSLHPTWAQMTQA